MLLFGATGTEFLEAPISDARIASWLGNSSKNLSTWFLVMFLRVRKDPQFRTRAKGSAFLGRRYSTLEGRIQTFWATGPCNLLKDQEVADWFLTPFKTAG